MLSDLCNPLLFVKKVFLGTKDLRKKKIISNTLGNILVAQATKKRMKKMGGGGHIETLYM